MEKKTMGEIETKLDSLSDSEKIFYLKDIYTKKEYSHLKNFIGSNIIKLTKKSLVTYKLTYDSFSEGLEPVYFWILDFMRDTSPGGLGLTVKKSAEEFEASISSSYFGEMGQRVTVMQQRSTEILANINNVIKSILNLIYDLKEFEIKIKMYDDLKSKDPEVSDSADRAIKSIWMDKVDSQKGLGSLNQLAQRLNFVTIRDAFFHVKSIEDIKKLDLNERVKSILKLKVEEFLHWQKESEKEIKKRFEIEKGYLKTQVETLKLYTTWVKPYLRAAQKLKMKEFNMPDIIASFNNMQMRLSLIGSKETKPESEFKKLNLKSYFAVVEVILNFRTVPQAISGQGGTRYIHGGRVDMDFSAYAYDSIEMEALENVELYEDMKLIEEITDVALHQLQEDIDHFLYPVEKEVKEEKKQKKFKPFESISKAIEPITDVAKGTKEFFGDIKSMFKLESNKLSYAQKKVKDAAEKTAKDLCEKTYTLYKKTHGMIAPAS